MTSGEDIVETELMRLFFAEGARAPVEEIEDSLSQFSLSLCSFPLALLKLC